jgi:serine protease Do
MHGIMAQRRSALWAASLVSLGLAIGFVIQPLRYPTMARGQNAAGLADPSLGDSAEPVDRDERFESLSRDVSHLIQQGRILNRIVQLVDPSVVHIDTEKTDRTSARYGGNDTVEETGSGVLIHYNDAHYVLTNWHVIKEAELPHITIRLYDGRELIPIRAWHDAPTDVAVLGVEGDRLIPARIGDSTRVEIGDFVLALGSPFGLSHSVTFGIISAKGRRDLELGGDLVKFQDFMQTDAAINPGNSGGPLINMRGEVIGINTAIASNSGGNDGIGFTIPVNMVMTIARQLIEQGSVVRAFLGVHLDRTFGPVAAAKLGLSQAYGARINGITPDSPAEASELRVGDVILHFNGTRVEDDSHLINIVSLTPVEKEVAVVVFREGKRVTVKVQVGDRAKFEPAR